MTQEALNIAGQCRATASSELAKNILVDEGNGLLTELLLDAARIIEALAQAQEPFCLHWEDRWGCNHYADPKEPHPVNAKPLYTSPPQRTEQNFCSRCGKRTKDLTVIHTCTPPQENT